MRNVTAAITASATPTTPEKATAAIKAARLGNRSTPATYHIGGPYCHTSSPYPQRLQALCCSGWCSLSHASAKGHDHEARTTMNWPNMRDHVVTAMATAGILGGGGTIIANKVAIGQHETRIEALESLSDKMDALTRELRDTREELIRQAPAR
jgi:hypothetical protein